MYTVCMRRQLLLAVIRYKQKHKLVLLSFVVPVTVADAKMRCYQVLYHGLSAVTTPRGEGMQDWLFDR